MKKILLLEDEEAIGSIYNRRLEEGGYEVMWLKNALNIETLARKFKPKLIILDNIIAGESRMGVDLIPVLMKDIPDAVIIILSNLSHYDVQEKARENGAKGYFVKADTPPSALLAFANQLV